MSIVDAATEESAPPTYRGLGGMPAFICSECGAMVWSVDDHSRWHTQLRDDRYEVAQMVESFYAPAP